MGVFSEDPSMMLRNVSKNRQNSINQFGGQYQPNQYLDYTDQMTNNGTMRDTPRIVDINQWQNQINQQGVSGIPDALSWNTYGSPSNPENQFFRKQYQNAQEIKWDVQNSYNRTPEEAEAQKNLFWLAGKYNLRIDPFKKDSDDEEIYNDSFRANFGDDKEGHYSAFKNLAQKYPEMAKKITKYQNYQAQANDRKAMEYDRRFGTQYYKRTSVEKSKPFSIEEWSRKAKEDIIKTNPDGTLRIDTGLAQKYMIEAHQMRLDQMDWGQTVINKIGRFAGGLLDFANPSTWYQNTDYGFDNEMYAKHKVEKETGGIGSLRWGDIVRDAPSNIVEAARSVSALIMSAPSLVGATDFSKGSRDFFLSGNYDTSEIIQSDINSFAEILRAGKENPIFDMKDIQGINHGTYDFLNSVGPTSGVLGIGALVGKLSSGGVGFIASMLAGEIAPSLWSGVQEAIFGKEAHRYNQLASFMEKVYPDHESIDNYDKITAGITDRDKRAERETISKQLRAMRENVIGDIKGDNSYLGSGVTEFWNRYGQMTGDVLMLGFAMNQGRNMFKVKGLSPSPENMAKFPKLNFADNFYANLYNNMYIRGGDKGYIRNIAEKSIGFIGSVGTEFKATDLKSINGKMDKFFEVAKRVGNYSTREALDAIPTWAVAEMLKHNGDLSTKQLTTAMETGMAYNVLGMAMSKGFQAVGKRAKFQDLMKRMTGSNSSEKLARFQEFKDNPFLKQFGEQYDIITYKSRVLGDWFANPVQGLFSAAVIEDGNWVDNADRYLRNEALGDLVTGALLSAHMAYGSKNARKNYAQIYDNIVAQERQKEMNANFEKQTKDFIEPDPEPEAEPQSEQSTPSTEPTSAEPPAPETEGKPDSAPVDLKDAMDYLHEVDDAEKLSEISSVDKSSDDETEANLESLSNTEELNNQVNTEEVPFNQNNATSDETVDPDTVPEQEYNNQDIGEGLSEGESADVDELKNTPVELGKDDSIAPPALGETKAKHQGIFVPKNQGIELAENPLQLRTSIEGMEYDVENINGQLMYKDQSGFKPLPKDAPTYSKFVNNEETVKAWVQNFGERVRDVWLKNIEENTGGHNKFLANAEVMLKTNLIKNYGVNPFVANLVNDEGMTSGKIKSLIGINSNINFVHDNMLKQKDQGKVLNAYESQQLALNHEMFHLMGRVFKDDPEYQRLKVQALEALKIIQEDDEGATKRYDINYRNYYEGEIRKLGKDISDPKIQERIQGFIDEERLSDMWGAFVVGNDKFKEETGLIGKWFKSVNERFVEKSGGYRGLLNLWRIGKKLELFDFITKQDVNANLDRWMSNKQATKRLDPAMASLAEKHAMTSNLVGLNIESKQIVGKLKELDNNLAHTSDVVDKFRGDWKDFNKYYDFLESRFFKQGANKIFNDQYDMLDFATKSYIKMHPNSYEENNSSSMFIFSHDGQRIDVRIAPYNGKAVATSSIPTKAYGSTQLGESHNVEKYRLKKSGWQKAQETFRIMLGKTADNKENSSVYYQDFLNDLSDESAIVRHPDNVGVMMPVRDQNYNMLTSKNRMGKDGKGHSFVRDADGYYVSPDNRYTLKSDVDEHGNVTTNLVKDKNGELHFKQHYKFDSAIYNSDNSIDITRRLLQSGYYPMPGTHVAMQTIDIHRIMEKVFKNNLNYMPTKNSEANLAALQAYGASIERIADYEHSQLKYFLESQYAQEEFGYFGKAIIPTNINNSNIPIIDLVHLVPGENGRLTVQINPDAKVMVEGNLKPLSEVSEKQQILEFSKDTIEGMQKALDSISGSFAPIANYYMNNEFRQPLFIKRDGSNKIEPIEDFYLNDIVSNPNDFIDRLYNQVEKINTIVNKDGMEIPRTTVDEIVHEAVKNVMLDKFLAVIDQQMLSAVDAGGKAFVLSGKYNHKYVSSLTHEWEAPNLRDLLPSLNKVRNYGKLMGMDGNLSNIAPQGLEVITDGNKEKQLALNAYIFDPDVWKAQYPEMTEHIDRLLAVLGKQSIDGATIMLNNDPYDLRPGMTIQEALGLIGGVNPTGSYKNRLHIGTTEGTLELKHAMHPLTYSDTKRVGELVPAGSEELGQLVALLRASGIGAIIMKSALKGDGTHSLKQKEIDGKIYGVGVFGDIRGEYDPTTNTFIPVKSIEGQDKVLNGVPTIPIKEMFNANESGLQLSNDNVELIRQRMIQIPLTGSKALSWGDGQKGKPHSVTGSAPFRFASFSKNSEYMVAPPPQATNNAIADIFGSNGKLNSIGTLDQYNDYINTIFPNSKMKDIVYHGSDAENIQEFSLENFGQTDVGDRGYGVYLSKNKKTAQKYGKNVYPVMTNIQNPYNVKFKDNDPSYFWNRTEQNTYKQDIDQLENDRSKWIEKVNNNDLGYAFFEGMSKSINQQEQLQFVNQTINKRINDIQNRLNELEAIGKSDGIINEEYEVITSPERTHILGSEKDIESFTKFVKSGKSSYTRAYDAFEGNANNAITNWVQNMAQGVQDLHNAFGDMSDYVSGLKQSFTKDELANVHNLVSELRDYIKNRVDRERDLDNDDSDEFMKQSLNYSTDTTDYKNTLRLIDKVLEKTPDELNPADLAPLFAMTDSVFENQFVTKLIAPEDSKTGVNTVFWQMMKFKHKNLVNLKGKGTMSVFVPNLDNRGDLARMTDLAEKLGMREQFEAMVAENDMYDAETGLWKDGSQAISISADVMKKFKLKPGDKIFAMLVPPDSAISAIPMRVMGLLHKDNQNAVAFNSKLALEFWGRDHDIDQVSIMINDNNWKDKQGNDGYGFLWDTLTHHGFHQGKPKQDIVDAKKILDSNKKNAGWTIKKNVPVRGKKEPFIYDIPNFNKLAQLPQFMKDGVFDNVYESRGYPVLSNLEANAPHDSRAYFSNKKIALAASLSNKMGSLIHKYDGEIEMGLGRGLNINLVDYSTLKKALGDRGEDSMYQSVSNLKFKVRHNDRRYDAHLPYVKEGTVDTYSQMPIEFQPYVWMATMLVDDISFNVNSKPNSEVTGAKFADIKDPVVRLYIAAQLRDLENKNFSGQFPKAAFDREGGYTYDNIRETMNKVSEMDEFSKHAFQSAMAHVLKTDFGIEASDRMELQATNSGALGVRNFNSIDDIILNTFKSLFYTNAKYGTDPMLLNDGEGFRSSFMTKKEQFEKDRGFNAGVAKYKAKMIKNTTAALQTLFHFNMLHDRLLPDSLFRPLNPMPPLMKSPDGIAFEGKVTNNLGNAETNNHGSLYFNTIDRISKMTYGWLSAFDQEYARFQKENDPRDWSMPEVDTGRERQLFSMQELFRNLIVSDDFAPYKAIHNDLLTEAFLDPIMNTFLDAEMNDNNKTSMIYHQDKYGRYLYDRTNPIDIMFPGALHKNANKFTSAANWTDSVNIHLANPDGITSAKNIKARMFLDGKGEPMLNITYDGRHYEYNGSINIPVEMLRDTRKMITEIFDPIKGVDSAGAYRLCAELVQAMAIGGKAYSSGLRKEGTKKAYGSLSLIGAIPNKASHKQNFLRLLYTNMIDSMGERALKNPAIEKDLIESFLGSQVDVTPQLIKNLVAGMVMGHPLGGESFNRYFGTQNGNKMTTDEFKPILGELNKLTQSVRNMYGNTQKGNLEFLNQTSIVTGKGATKNNNKITKLINDGGKTQYLAQDLTASRTPGDVLTYLNILEDVAMRYATQVGERPEMLNKIKNSLMGIKDLQDEIVKYMDPMQYNQLNENKTKWKHFEELFNGNAFMFTPLGQKVMQELDNKGTTPSVIYNSKENGIVHDIRDMASKLMVEYSKSESTGQGEQDILPRYSLFDDFVPTYESISKLNNKVPNYIKAMRIMDHIVGFFRRNSTVSSKFRDSVNTYMKDKKFSDGTPVTFEHLFDYSTMKGGLTMAADKVVRADEVSQLLKGYFYNELANIYNLSPAERKAQYELWNKADTSPKDAPNVKAKDYVARLAFEQLKAISRTSAIVLDKALNDFELDSMGRSNTTAFLNKHAENIAEMFHVLKDYKQYEKYKAKQMKSKAMTIEQANNSVEQAIKLNLNITQRNSPETLCKLFGRQKVLVRGSVVIMPTFDVDENGKLVEGKPTAIALNSDQTSPNMFLGVTSNSEQEVRVSDTGSIILNHADAIRDLVNRSERAKNDATAELLQSMGKVTLEQEEEYNSALKMINDVMPEYFSHDFRIRFAKISGRIVPMAEFKFNNETIHASHTAVGERLSDVQRKFVQEFRSRIKSKKEEGDIHDFTYLQKSPIAEKALQNWLLVKIVAAHQGVAAKQYISVLDNLLSKLDPLQMTSNGSLYDPYTKQFQLTRDELQQIVDLTLFADEQPHPDYPNVKVANKESFYYLPGSSINMNQMKLNVRTKIDQLIAQFDAGNTQIYTDDKVSLERICRIFGTTLEKVKEHPKALREILESAKGYVSRQSNVDNEDEQYTMKDRMVGTVKRTGLTMNNRITMELLAMADTGERVYAGSVTPKSIDNLNQLMDKSFNMAAYGLLGKIYDHISTDMRQQLKPAYGIEVNGHIEENPLVTTEVYNQLAEMRGESVAYSEMLEKDDNGSYDLANGDVVSVDYKVQKGDKFKFKSTKGLVIEESGKSILLWIPSKNTFERVPKVHIKYAKRGLAYNDEYKAYLDTIQRTFKTLNLPTESINQFLTDRDKGWKNKDYDVVNNMDANLQSESNNITDAIYKQDVPWKARMSRVRKYGIAAEALGGYQGGMKLIGGVVAGATSLGAFALGNPVAGSALGGYAITQFMGYLGKQAGAIGQNYGSALMREMMPINGLFKTMKDALGQTVKETTSDTQSAITNSISTFMKDEVTQKQMISDMDRPQVNSLINLLSKANSVIDRDEKLGKAFRDFENGNIKEIHVRLAAQKALEDNMAPDDDYAKFWLDHIDFDYESRQYILQNGHEINSLMKLKHDLIKDKITNLLTFGQLIARSEETSKKLGSKVFAQYLDEEQIVTGANQNEVSTIIDRFMDRSAGNYKSNKRLSKNKHGFNQLLTLYERFNRDNNAYYMNDIYKAIDKSLSIDFLAQNFGGYGKTDRGTYNTVKGITTEDGEVLSVTTAYNIDELKAFKKKLAITASMAVTNMLSKAGMLLLAGYVTNEELAKKLKTMFSGVEAVSGIERYTSIGGFLHASTNAALLAGTAMLYNHNEMLRGTTNKAALKSLIKDEIRNSGSILQSAGVGLGYSKIFELPMGLGNQFMLHEMRTISPKIQKMMDEESHEYWINYTTGLTKLFGMFSLAEKMGSIGTTTVGLMMGNDSYKSDLAHTIALPSDERKAKKKKKKQSTEPTDNNVDINR